MDLKVNGFQEGVMASSIKIGIDEESLTGSDDKANLRVDPSPQSNKSWILLIYTDETFTFKRTLINSI